MRRLLIRPGAIGDCILSLPALEHLRTDYTEAWVPTAIVPLIRFADRVRSISSTGLDLLGLPDTEHSAALLESLRSFDSIVSWYGSNREEFREVTARLRLPIQFFAALPPDAGKIHAADLFLSQAGGAPAAFPRIDCPASARRDVVIIHPFSGSTRKNWPLQNYRDLAGRLRSKVEWCASPEEELENAIHIDNLYELACRLSSARLYIGNDSGISHLAAAAGVPVIAIFGPTDPAVWAPRGSVSIIQGDLTAISVEQVLRTALESVDWR